eukprot:Skav222089  [mRNA]  locus=scaffold2165:169128:179481:- [translate_table: standard]
MQLASLEVLRSLISLSTDFTTYADELSTAAQDLAYEQVPSLPGTPSGQSRRADCIQSWHVIFDDKCDESVGSDIVVSAMAEKDTYVGIAGMGCDRVCRPIASLATSLRLPFLSYECPSPDFSDTLGYPALARMGTVTKPALLSTVQALKAQNSWNRMYVVSGDPAFYQVRADTGQHLER